MNFGRAEYLDYQKHIIPIFGSFLRKCYPVEDCKARALPPTEGFQGIASTLEDDNPSGHSVHEIPMIAPPAEPAFPPTLPTYSLGSSVTSSSYISAMITAPTAPLVITALPMTSGAALPPPSKSLSPPPSRDRSPPPSREPSPPPSRAPSPATPPLLSPSPEPDIPFPDNSRPPSPNPYYSPVISGIQVLPSASVKPAITNSVSFKLAELVRAYPLIPQDSISAFQPATPVHPPLDSSQSPNPSATLPARLPVLPETSISVAATTPNHKRGSADPCGDTADEEGPLTKKACRSEDSSTTSSNNAERGGSSSDKPPPRGRTGRRGLGIPPKPIGSRMVLEVAIPTRHARPSNAPPSRSHPSDVPPALPAATAASSPHPSWFSKCLEMFQSQSLNLGKSKYQHLGDEWLELIKEWASFEEAHNFKPSQKLSTKHRPAAVSMWVGRGRSTMWRPEIDDAKAFGKEFNQWWLELQPSWRNLNGRLAYREVDGDWECLRSPGPNGLLSVVAMLFYWGLVAHSKTTARQRWLKAVEDVHVALVHLRTSGMVSI